MSARRTGLGLVAVLLGLYLQLAGLVSGGLGYTGGAAVVGVGLTLTVLAVLDGLRLAGARALGTVVVATAGIGLCTVLLFAGGGTEATQLPAGRGGHAHGGAIGTTELPADVDTALRTSGTAAALTRLDELFAGASYSPVAQHQLVHEAARRSLRYAGGDVAAAFRGCDDRFNSACYHGVLQSYFAADPPRALAELPQMCDGVAVAADAPPLLRFHCVHGLGHGLAVVSPDDPEASLHRCDALAPADRADCYGGVFMEQVVSTAGRPGYTCDSISAQYLEQCYVAASAVILLANGRDVPAAFAECDAAPRPYVAACYEGMGRDIVGITRFDPAQVAQQCGQGSSAYRRFCTTGAAQTLVSTVGAGRALEFCGVTNVGGRSSCFEQVGELLYTLHPDDPARRGQECAAAEPAGLAPCRTGAGLT